MSMASVVMVVVSALVWLFPAPADKFGWGLRLRPSDVQRVYLAQESLWDCPLEVVLINRSRDARQHMPLKLARSSGDLEVTLKGPGGKTLRYHREDIGGEAGEERSPLSSGRLASSPFVFQDFGYYRLPEAGDYELRGSLRTTEGMVVAPAFKLRVIEPTADAILHSQPVPLEGQSAKWTKERQERAVIQQIKIGNQTWLFYRQFESPENGGKVGHAFRIAELPGKVVDLKVEGAFGDWNPLTITYRETTYTKWTTTHVINSVSGSPWTAEEEKHRQEKRKLEAKLPADKK